MIPTTCVVALPIPADKPYRYSVPASIADRVVPGARVVVPVRSRQMIGVVLELGHGSEDGLKAVLLAPDSGPLLSSGLLELGRWLAGYYLTPIGLTLRAMMPSALWGRSRLIARIRNPDAAPGGASREVVHVLQRSGGRLGATQLSRRLGRPAWDSLQRLVRVGAVSLETEPLDLGPPKLTERVLVLTERLPSLVERARVFGRARRQRAAYETVEAMGGEVSVSHLRSQAGFSTAVLNGVVERGVARIEERSPRDDALQRVVSVPHATPTETQSEAIAEIRNVSPGKSAMLFGVTGSGKTLVYLEALRSDVAEGAGAIILVPEIALTPQTIARVYGALGDTVVVLHSRLSDRERADAWRALAAGDRRVAVGTRSAVFAPVHKLGAIVVDEEHDTSYKNGEAPRYHARDVAARRATIEGARLILASATPSLETWARSSIAVVSLPERIAAQPMPRVSLLDLRSEPRTEESGVIPWTLVLDRAVEEELGAGNQIILLLNRRGYASFLQCPGCGSVKECTQCSISLTVHRTPAELRCHYCGYREAIPPVCEECGHSTPTGRGIGTQSLEQWLAERFPAARLARMDADTTSSKWSHGRILDAVARRDVDILFGTQMIAKGLDFPKVTLVGVIDSDMALHLPDFRSAERTFQLVAQVAGRAGRGPRGGRVLVQTRNPGHYALTAAAAHDFIGFSERELEVRRSPPYPPHVGLVNVVVNGIDEVAVAEAAVGICQWLRGLVAAKADSRVDVMGPAPAPLQRIKRRWRWHIMLRGEDRGLLDRVTRYAARHAPFARGGTVRVAFDRDPVSVL
ncbi:MAG: primosomal protein N' [Gemmatimonadales bacterium]